MPNLIGQLLPLIGILVLLAIVVGVINILTAGRRTPKGYPYEKEDSLFSPAERSFLGVLEQAVGENYRIFGKVRLADIIRVKRGGSPAFPVPGKTDLLGAGHSEPDLSATGMRRQKGSVLYFNHSKLFTWGISPFTPTRVFQTSRERGQPCI